MIGFSKTQTIELVSSEYGLIFLIILCLLEGSMLLYFIPSELIVPIGLYVFGTRIEIVTGVVLLTTFSTTVGQLSLFYACRSKGKNAIQESSILRISEDRIQKYEKWFDKWGQFGVSVTNTLPLVRGIMTIPAGFSDISYQRFVILAFIGTLVFESIISALYLIGVEALAV